MGEVADWREALKADAKKQQVAEQQAGSGLKYISLAGGCMTIGEDAIPNNTIECVVLASVAERTWYDRPYNPDDKGPPDCFALGEDAKHLQPHGDVPDGQAPATKCSACPKAEFGTALQGRGPACKTRRRLIVMSKPLSEDMALDSDLAQLKVPPTSVTNWSKYAMRVSGQGLPVWAVGTEVVVKPHPKKQLEVTFTATSPLPDAVLSVLHGRLKEAHAAATHPFSYEELDKDY